jgi:O-antigen/teichoic acid export membrane protein
MDGLPDMAENAPERAPLSRTSLTAPVSVSTSRNVLSNFVGNVILVLTAFILTPILISRLGDYQYGMWTLTMYLLSAYGLLDCGMRITLQRFVARFRGRNEREALDEVLVSVMVLMVALSLLACCLTGIIVVVMPSFFHIAGTSRSLFQWLVGLLGLAVAIDLPARALSTYLAGLQRFDLYNMGAIITTIARAVLVVLALRLGYGLLGVAVATVGMELLSLPLHWRLVRLADPQASLSWRKARWSCMREMAGFSFYAYLNNGGDYLRFYTDSVVISRLLTVALVTPFSAAGRLMDNFKGLIWMFTSPLMPRMTELDGQSKPGELRDFFLRSTRGTALLSLFIGSLLLLDGKSLLRLWLGGRFVPSYTLLLVLTAGYVVAMSQLPSVSLMFAKGQHRLLGWWTIGEGAANLILSIFWARRYGLIGVALGTTVPMLVTGLLIQPWYVVRLFEMPVRRYIRQALARPILACSLFVAVSGLVFHGQTQTTVGGFVLVVACQGGLFALLAYAAGINDQDRRLFRERCGEWAVLLRRTRTA